MSSSSAQAPPARETLRWRCLVVSAQRLQCVVFEGGAVRDAATGNGRRLPYAPPALLVSGIDANAEQVRRGMALGVRPLRQGPKPVSATRARASTAARPVGGWLAHAAVAMATGTGVKSSTPPRNKFNRARALLVNPGHAIAVAALARKPEDPTQPARQGAVKEKNRRERTMAD